MTPQDISLYGFLLVGLILLAIAGAVTWRILQADLTTLICEPPDENGKQKASLSRFQLLVFTFVIAGLYLTLCIEAGTFIDIPPTALGLLGISGGSFVISKQVGKPEKPKPE